MANSSFKISIYPQNMAAVHFKGSLNADVMRRAADECAKRDCYHIVVVLHEVEYAPSTALGTFFEWKGRTDARSGRLLFITPPEGPVKIMMDFLEFSTSFSFFETLNEALQDIAQNSRHTRKFSL